MRFVDHLINRTPYERTFHAVSFEVVGIITSTPIVSFLSGKDLASSSLIALIVSILATIWNYIYNYLYDKLLVSRQIEKTTLVRVLHGIGFEAGLILISVPTLSLIMGLTLWAAFTLELGMILYFLPFAVVFNWIYDKIKDFAIVRLQARQKA